MAAVKFVVCTCRSETCQTSSEIRDWNRRTTGFSCVLHVTLWIFESFTCSTGGMRWQVDRSTALQVVSSRVRFPTVSSKCFYWY